MGRLSGALARMWQALLAGGRGVVQIYMDDPIIFLAGPREERARNLSMLLYSARAMGLNLAFEKGDRGAQVKWIGVKIQLEVQRRTVELTIPRKVIEEINAEVDSWRGMASLRRLRAVTGRMSWLAGVLPRLRWVVSIMYAVLADAEEDKRTGVESERAEFRLDKRDKSDLVAIKRLRLPMAVINYMAENPDRWLYRSISLKPERPSMGIITDASPQGIGGILVAVNDQGGTLEPQEAFEFEVDEQTAKFLGITLGESSSQAILEAWAILVACRIWSGKLRGRAMIIKSDSVVALATSRKFSAGSPTLNWIGAELALWAEQMGIQRMVGHHLAGSLNFEADWLSRPQTRRASLPRMLEGIRIKSPSKDKVLAFELKPPSEDPELWGQRPEMSRVFADL